MTKPARGRRQRQRAAAPGKVVDELLGERAAPGDAEDVDLADAERVEQAGRQPRQPGEAVGQRRRRRAADARHVEGDDAGVAEVRREGRHRLEARADPVEDEERARGALGAVAAPRGSPVRRSAGSGCRPGSPRAAPWLTRPRARRCRARRRAAGAGASPSAFGAATCSPPRASSQASQCGHQLPAWVSAPARNSSGVACAPSLVRKRAFGLPGGLISDWMWPDWLSTNVALAAEPAAGQVAAVPGRDVVGLAAHQVGVAGDVLRA